LCILNYPPKFYGAERTGNPTATPVSGAAIVLVHTIQVVSHESIKMTYYPHITERNNKSNPQI
jgi:hypothetical protein